MDIGLWMSRGVLEHKRQGDVAVQVWNLRRLPDGFSDAASAGRLFVAVEGHWRGFFRLSPGIMRTEADSDCPYALVFDPKSWTAISPERSPSRDQAGYTLDVPAVEVVKPGGRTRQENEMEELSSLLEREEERE